MQKFIQILFAICFVGTALATTCVVNNTENSTITVSAGEAVGQYLAGSYITECLFTTAFLNRFDSEPISGTFYIIPGQSNDTSGAIYSTSFSSSNDTISVSGFHALNNGSGYTFLWVRDLTGNDTAVYLSGDVFASSRSFSSQGGFADIDATGSFCFEHVNVAPVHSLAGIVHSTPNVMDVNYFPNLGAPHFKLLNPSISDSDANPSDIIHWKIWANVIIGDTTVNKLSCSQSDLLSYLDSSQILDLSDNCIELEGNVTGIQNALLRGGFRLLYVVGATIDVFVNVTDYGHNGYCSNGSYPCEMWSASKTEFHASS